MDGIHDMGGMHGFGAIPRDRDYVFRADWQRRAFALAEALGGVVPYSADSHRQALERIPAADYLRRDYFEKWTIAVEGLLLDAGLVSSEELTDGKKRFDADMTGREAVRAEGLREILKTGLPPLFPDDPQQPRFALHQPVRVLNDHPAGHTRSPRYLRGRLGKVERLVGVMQFADSLAASDDPSPQHCYTVGFDGPEIWGRDAEPGTLVLADLWESYLEPA
ncbi:MAG: nitrile hydratase subunit beta [Rhodospirillales bacterium]